MIKYFGPTNLDGLYVLFVPSTQGKGTLFRIFKIQIDEIILPEVADRFLCIGWVPMS